MRMLRPQRSFKVVLPPVQLAPFFFIKGGLVMTFLTAPLTHGLLGLDMP